MQEGKKTKQIVLRDDETSSEVIRVRLVAEMSELHVVLGARAKAVIVDVSTSAEHAIRVEMGKESSLDIISLSNGSARTCQSSLEEGAHVFWHCITVGAAPKPHTLVSTLHGPNAKSYIDWVFSVRGNETQKVSVRNIFGAPNGGGEITIKGVAEDKAHACCDGMIEITEQGGGTNTYLTEDVLMLDPTAKIDAIPGLEIRTNDVKASHSATVSRVTPEDLFYFRSRGITPDVARDMYVDGFLGDLTERIPHREELAVEVHTALKRS